MKSFPFSSRAAALPLALAAAFPLSSHAQAPALKETVVTATRSATFADELVSDVMVIDRKAIEASTARTLPELLARTAGVQITNNGGRGKNSGVFLRGTEPRHTILLVDGVRLASATAGTPSWEHIQVDMIERIEVLKGPASALYGSDGVGGVVQVFMRKGVEGFHPSASLTVGSEEYVAAAAGFQAGQGGWRYALGVQRLREQGFSATNPNVPFGQFNPDRDPFEQDSVNATASYEISKDWSVDAGLMYADGISWFDDGPGFDARSAVRALTAHAGIKGRLSSAWRTELRVAQGEDTSNTIEASFPGSFKTEETQWLWQNHIDTPLGVVLAGLERREQNVSATTPYPVTRRTIDSAFAGINGSAGAHSWQFNWRRDHNSQFGDVDTGLGGYGYRISPAWRVHAAHGTSFVAPSFNQLYFPFFGNPLLQPERGRNTDVGVTWAADGHEVKLVRFDNKIRGFMTNTTLPVNIPHVRIDGWTLAYEGKLGALGLRAAFDALDPRNEADGNQLPRRAKRQATAGADYARARGASAVRCFTWATASTMSPTPCRCPPSRRPTSTPSGSTPRTGACRPSSTMSPTGTTRPRLATTRPGRSFYLTLRWQPK